MQRAIFMALAIVLATGILAATALACVEDSQELALIDGELPGGG